MKDKGTENSNQEKDQLLEKEAVFSLRDIKTRGQLEEVGRGDMVTIHQEKEPSAKELPRKKKITWQDDYYASKDRNSEDEEEEVMEDSDVSDLEWESDQVDDDDNEEQGMAELVTYLLCAWLKSPASFSPSLSHPLLSLSQSILSLCHFPTHNPYAHSKLTSGSVIRSSLRLTSSEMPMKRWIELLIKEWQSGKQRVKMRRLGRLPWKQSEFAIVTGVLDREVKV